MLAVIGSKWPSVFIVCELTCTCILDLSVETHSHMAGKGDITCEKIISFLGFTSFSRDVIAF